MIAQHKKIVSALLLVQNLMGLDAPTHTLHTLFEMSAVRVMGVPRCCHALVSRACVSVCVCVVGWGRAAMHGSRSRITVGSRSDHASDHRFLEFRIRFKTFLIHIQFRSATVHSSVTQPEPASLGSVLLRAISRRARDCAGRKYC